MEEWECPTCQHKGVPTCNKPCQECISSDEGFPNWQPEVSVDVKDKLREAKNLINDALNNLNDVPWAGLPHTAKCLVEDARNGNGNGSRLVRRIEEIFRGKDMRRQLGSERTKTAHRVVAMIFGSARLLRYVLGGGPVNEALQLKIQLKLAEEFRMPHRCQGDEPTESTINSQFGAVANVLHRAYRSEHKRRHGGH